MEYIKTFEEFVNEGSNYEMFTKEGNKAVKEMMVDFKKWAKKDEKLKSFLKDYKKAENEDDDTADDIMYNAFDYFTSEFQKRVEEVAKKFAEIEDTDVREIIYPEADDIFNSFGFDYEG